MRSVRFFNNEGHINTFHKMDDKNEVTGSSCREFTVVNAPDYRQA